MSTSSRLGLGQLSFPQIMPVVGAYTAIFGLGATLLSLNVVRTRLNTGAYHGTKSGAGEEGSDPLYLANRTHANFLESVPIVLALASVIEINGGDRQYLNYGLATFTLLRLAHAFGLAGGLIEGRRVGYFGTQGLTMAMAGWSAYLSKSYWGF